MVRGGGSAAAGAGGWARQLLARAVAATIASQKWVVRSNRKGTRITRFALPYAAETDQRGLDFARRQDHPGDADGVRIGGLPLVEQAESVATTPLSFVVE